jgi:hypothetical protein
MGQICETGIATADGPALYKPMNAQTIGKNTLLQNFEVTHLPFSTTSVEDFDALVKQLSCIEGDEECYVTIRQLKHSFCRHEYWRRAFQESTDSPFYSFILHKRLRFKRTNDNADPRQAFQSETTADSTTTANIDDTELDMMTFLIIGYVLCRGRLRVKARLLYNLT